MTARALVGLAILASLAACADPDTPAVRQPDAEPTAERGIVMLDAVAGVDSAQPRLRSTPDGGAVLSWLQPDGDGHVLRYAMWDGTSWGPSQTADRGDNWFVNWADTPGVVALGDGRLLAHSLVRQPAGGYAYDVRARLSDGAYWSEPVTPHTDGTAAEHGFVSAVSLGDRAGLVWLDGREQAAGGHHGGDMTLRYAALGIDGELTDEAVLDTRACDCCPTAAVLTDRGLVVAYRDRSASEVRDVSVVRLVDGAWTDPERVHDDGWEINACPVNGPALAARGDRVALAWFTGADSARVELAMSDDGGAGFGDPITIDARSPDRARGARDAPLRRRGRGLAGARRHAGGVPRAVGRPGRHTRRGARRRRPPEQPRDRDSPARRCGRPRPGRVDRPRSGPRPHGGGHTLELARKPYKAVIPDCARERRAGIRDLDPPKTLVRDPESSSG